jgi:predicted methyltransferase
MKNVVHVVRDFDDPIPPDVSNLDLITFFFAYHDITYMPVDRAAMNRKMFAALKPGGLLVIADHSANRATDFGGQDPASDRGEDAARGD